VIRLDGKALAQERRTNLSQKTQIFSEKWGQLPCLAVVLVGDDPASQVYVRNKIKACKEAGITSIEKRLAADVSQETVMATVEALNGDATIHGILVQLPLPSHLEADLITQCISPLKDVDGLHFENLGLLFAGQTRVAPCTPWGVIQILKKYEIPLVGAEAVVIGRSQIVGKPMGQLLLNESATVTFCHSKTQDLRSHLKKADIVVVAAGRPGLIGKDDLHKDAVVIDVGIHRKDDGKLCGDVRFDEIDGFVKAATPVPGGVGPMTIAMLLENTLHLAQLQLQKRNRNRGQ